MISSTLTTKGQTTIPKMIREFLNLKNGDKLFFDIQDDEVVIKAASKHISEIEGLLPKPKKVLSLDAMNRIIAKSAGK